MCHIFKNSLFVSGAEAVKMCTGTGLHLHISHILLDSVALRASPCYHIVLFYLSLSFSLSLWRSIRKTPLLKTEKKKKKRKKNVLLFVIPDPSLVLWRGLRLHLVKPAGSKYHAVCLWATTLQLLMNECTGRSW